MMYIMNHNTVKNKMHDWKKVSESNLVALLFPIMSVEHVPRVAWCVVSIYIYYNITTESDQHYKWS